MNYVTSYIKAKNYGFVVGSTIFFFKCRVVEVTPPRSNLDHPKFFTL
jgi:hypothetical protein